MNVFSPPLPLTPGELEFAKKQGWGNVGVNRVPRSFAVKPDGATCGINYAIREIRRALANLEAKK